MPQVCNCLIYSGLMFTEERLQKAAVDQEGASGDEDVDEEEEEKDLVMGRTR